MSQAYFQEISDWALTQIKGDEVLLASVAGEATDFIRFNNGAIRQAGTVTQQQLSLTLIDGTKQTSGHVQLAADRALDDVRVGRMLTQLRDQLQFVSDDPYIAYSTNSSVSEDIVAGSVPDSGDVLGSIADASKGRDMVGIYAAGDSFGGFASSLGQRNWFQRSTFNLDWSFYLRDDKAAKNLYAGMEWSDDAFGLKVAESASHLGALDREPVVLKPGAYRSFLTPTAVGELMGLLSWDAFGLQAMETKQTSLLRMVTDGQTMADEVSISESTGTGVAASFSEFGFARPDKVELISGGRHAGTLVSARSSKQYGVETNGANTGEQPESLAIAPGSVPTADVLAELGTGIYVGNLWYTNYSDRTACRTTGLTRFATFWVEGGEIVAPINVMRFDDTIYSLLGEQLVGLTDQSEMMLDAASYEQRSTTSMNMPGALVNEMKFTL